MKKLLVVFLGFLCVLSACQKGPKPKDSLIAAGNAIRNCDVNNIDKYIDISSLISNAIDVAAKQEIKELPKDKIMGLTAMKAIIIPIAKQYVLEGIRQLSESEYKEYLKLIKVKKYEILDNKDGVASARVIFDYEDAKKYALEKNLIPEEAKQYMQNTETPAFILKMKQNGDYWQIAEISNLDELIKKYAPLYEEQMKEAKAKRQQVQEEKFRKWEEENIKKSQEEYAKFKRENDQRRAKMIDEELASKKQEFFEHSKLIRLITDSQRRYYKKNGKYTDNFNNLDFDFNNVNNILSKGSSSFTTIDLVTYIIDKEKVTETSPQKYTIELYYSEGKLICQDNNNGSCIKIGAANIMFNFYPAPGKIR